MGHKGLGSFRSKNWICFKDSGVHYSENDGAKKGLARVVVLDLLNGYHGKNHLLHVDNFYTSPELLIELLEVGVYCTGTIRTNRKYFPTELVPPTYKLSIFKYARETRKIKEVA